MKRIISFALCMLLLLVGCSEAVENSGQSSSIESVAPHDESGTTESGRPDESGIVDNSAKNGEIASTWRRVRAGAGYSEGEPKVLIGSGDALDEYYSACAAGYEEGTEERVRALIDPDVKYTEEFFEDNFIVLALIYESSGSTEHCLNNVEYKDGGLCVNILRYTPDFHTNDLAAWLMIVELEREYIVDSADSITVNISTGTSEDVVEAQMNFASELLKEAYKQNGDKNLLISPLSVQLAISMTANGANGKTLSEMQKLLCGNAMLVDANRYFSDYLEKLSEEDETLKIANSIWLRDTQGLAVKDSFLKINEDTYNAQVFRRAFDQGTADEINSWVDEKTDGMIDKIIEEIGADAVAYIINALCFEDEWAVPYSESDIQNGEFKSISGEVRQVEMMNSEEGRYIETENAKGFVKNYKDSKYAFYAVLPNEDVAIGDYVKSLDAEGLKTLITGTKASCGFAKLPKFKSEYFASLNDTLKTLGMPTAFNSIEADFTNMAVSEDGNIYIGNVLHKTFIQVDELGTKAGAVTSVEMDVECAPMYEWWLTFDRPFVYMIVDTESGIPVFIGVLNDITA